MAEINPHFNRDIVDSLLNEIRKAQFSIRLAAYHFNEQRLINELILKADSGLQVECIVDAEQMGKDLDVLYGLEQSNICLYRKKITTGKYAKMHHKFCVIDNATLITGSFNWTNNGSNYSDENVVIINDQTTAESYRKQFERLKISSEFSETNYNKGIEFSVSNFLVKKGSSTLLRWDINSSSPIYLDDEEVLSSGTKSITITSDQKFTLSANGKTKTVAVFVVQEPTFEYFRQNTKLIRYGESVELSWSVKNGKKVTISTVGRVREMGTINTSPSIDTTFELSAEDALGQKYAQFLFVKVLSIPIVKMELLKLPVIDIQVANTFTIKGNHLMRYHKKGDLYAILKNEEERKRQEYEKRETEIHKQEASKKSAIFEEQIQLEYAKSIRNTKTSIWSKVIGNRCRLLGLVRGKKQSDDHKKTTSI